jgi:uncharacterized coiled-coil protein SlyX
MNDDTIQDLKQFIATTITQQTSEIVVRLDKVDMRLDKVEQKLEDISLSVAEAIENSNEATDTQLKDHENRIVHLEHKIA